MIVRPLLDHHVNHAIATGLRERGVDVMTCAEAGAEECEDERILELAAEMGRAVFTQDDDFLAIAVEWFDSGRIFPGVIYAKQLKITVGQVIRDLELIAKAMEAADIENRIQFLPLKERIRR